jgi:hypothetical protein
MRALKMPNRIAGHRGVMNLSSSAVPHFPSMKPNINKEGRVARGGIAVIFLLAGACLIPEASVLAAVFILIGLFCAFEAWIGWCAVRACGVKTPL